MVLLLLVGRTALVQVVVPLGREEWLRRLDPLPRVSLLRAPASTGKRTVARYVASASGVDLVDQRLWPEPHWLNEVGRPVDSSSDRDVPTTRVEPELSMGMVREIVEWSRTAPLVSRGKVVVVRLSHVCEDGSEWCASEHVCATLLKTLEEPRSTVSFILLASAPVPDMVRSRVQVVLEAGLLSSGVLAEVLVRCSELTPAEAAGVSVVGGGRVSSALAHRGVESAVSAVTAVLTYLAARDRVALAERSRSWSDMETELLTVWCQECLSGCWRVFGGAEVPRLSWGAAERVLSVLVRVRGARPRLVLGAVAALVES